MAKNPRGSRVEILCDHVANLDEEIDEGYKENENQNHETRY